jgi:hypothetical protein
MTGGRQLAVSEPITADRARSFGWINKKYEEAIDVVVTAL